MNKTDAIEAVAGSVPDNNTGYVTPARVRAGIQAGLDYTESATDKVISDAKSYADEAVLSVGSATVGTYDNTKVPGDYSQFDPAEAARWLVLTAGITPFTASSDWGSLEVTQPDLDSKSDVYFFRNTDGTWVKFLSEKVPGPDNSPGPYTELTSLVWHPASDGRHKFKELSDDASISVSILDGDEAILLLTGNGYTLTVNGVAIVTDSVSDMMIGITRGNDKLVILSKNVTTGSIEIIEAVEFTGADLTNTSGVVSTSSTDSSFGHTGIDNTATLPANTAGRIWMQWNTGDINGVFGFTEGSTAVGFASMKAAFFKNDIAWGKSDNGSVIGISGVPAPTNGNYYGLYRDSSGALILQESTDQIVWSTLHTFTANSTAALRVVCDLAGSTAIGGVGTISHPKRNF